MLSFEFHCQKLMGANTLIQFCQWSNNQLAKMSNIAVEYTKKTKIYTNKDGETNKQYVWWIKQH